MRPLVIRGNVWRVVRVSPDDPFLIDRTGMRRVATTDPSSRTIRISEMVMPPMFDRVYLHEAAHAMMEESRVNDTIDDIPWHIFLEEMLAWFLETYSIEIVDAVSRSLGRQVCVGRTCIGGTQ